MRSPAVPLFFAASLGALVGLAAHVAASPFALGAAIVALACAVVAVVARGLVLRAAGLVVVAAALGAAGGAWQRAVSERRGAALPYEDAVYDGVVDDITFGKTGARRLIVDVNGAIAGPAPGEGARPLDATLAVTLLAPERTAVNPGDRVRVRGRARPIEPALSPGEIDERQLGLARGVDGSMLASAVVVTVRDERPAPFSRMRLWLRDRLSSLIPPRMAGLELALLVGDVSLLDDAQRDIYRRAGAGHLLAVSGLQVSLLALILRQGALAVILATSLGRRGGGRTLASIIALAGVWAFICLCGIPPSAVRAGAMATAILAAPLFHRRVRSLDALGIAGLLTVLFSPGSVIDPSFLLSYAAVLGLAATAGIENKIAAAVVASVGAGIVTLPISAYMFGQVAPAGLVDNIILVPAAVFLQVPALAFGLFGALFDSAWLAWLGGETALVLEALTKGLGDLLPGVRAVEAPSGALTVVLFACALAFAGAVARRRVVVAVVCAAVAVAAIAFERREPPGVRITALPVGQGDGAVFEFPDGAVMVVDGGGTWSGRTDPGTDVVLPFLARRGIKRVDLIVLSHPHPDHALGLVPVARALPVTTLWHNGSDAALARVVVDAVVAGGGRVETTPGILGAHEFHGGTIEVLAPAPAEKTPTYPELEANDNSIVLRVCFKHDCALWPGDIEIEGEDLLLKSTGDVRAALVKAPHHGSATSSTDAFIRATGARDVVFCTGRDNGFAFPAQAVMDRWGAAGARMWETGRNGEIRMWLTGDGVVVRSFVDATPTAGTR